MQGLRRDKPCQFERPGRLLGSVITHVVAFRYHPSTTQQQRTEVLKGFLSLEHECARDGENYIVSLIGGDCTGSPEGLTAGFDHVFIVTFKDREDFEYYLGPPFAEAFDTAHDDFKKFAIPLLSVDADGKTNGAMVFDFATSTS